MNLFKPRHCLLWVLLLLGGGSAWGNWVRIATSDQSVYFFEPTLTKKAGANRIIIVVRDHAHDQYGSGGIFKSSKDEIELDCRNLRVRRIYSSDHPLPKGEGKFVSSEHGPMSWNAATPGSIARRMVDLACL